MMNKNNEIKVIGGIGEKKSNGGTQFYNQNRIYDNKIATAIPTSFQPYYLTNRERERVMLLCFMKPKGFWLHASFCMITK